MTPARIGFLLSTRLAATHGRDDPRAFVAQAVSAEAAGLDSLWVGDSLVARPRLEPISLLGALATAT